MRRCRASGTMTTRRATNVLRHKVQRLRAEIDAECARLERERRQMLDAMRLADGSDEGAA